MLAPAAGPPPYYGAVLHTCSGGYTAPHSARGGRAHAVCSGRRVEPTEFCLVQEP